MSILLINGCENQVDETSQELIEDTQKGELEEAGEDVIEEKQELYVTRPARETKPAFPVQFTHYVIDLSHYQRLIPPGSVSLDTFAEHGYLTLKEGVERSPIYAPTDVDVLGISYYSYSDPWSPETKS